MLMAWAIFAIINVYPSGVDLAATSAPRLPAAPGRLSITTCRPSASDSGGATKRATTSFALPGGNGTMRRIVFAGYWDQAGVPAASAAASQLQRRIDNIRLVLGQTTVRVIVVLERSMP